MSENTANAPSLEEKDGGTVKWAAFVESDVVNFFDLHELEKMTIEDGRGNKAKLNRIKDNGIKIEYTSLVVL